MAFFADFTNLFLLLMIVVSGYLLFAPMLKNADAHKISTLETTQLINRNQAYVWDVRPSDAFAQGSLMRAKNIPLDKIADNASKANLKKDKPLILLSQDGARLVPVVKQLQALGFGDVRVLTGGIDAWLAAGLPVVKNSVEKA